MQESRSPGVLIRLPCGLRRPVPMLLGPPGCLQHALQWPVEVEKSVTGDHQTPERLHDEKGTSQPGQIVQAGLRHEAARGNGGGWVAPPISTSPPFFVEQQTSCLRA